MMYVQNRKRQSRNDELCAVLRATRAVCRHVNDDVEVLGIATAVWCRRPQIDQVSFVEHSQWT